MLSSLLSYAFAAGAAGDDFAAGVGADSAGFVYMTGGFSNTIDLDPGSGAAQRSSAGGLDIYLAKYSPAGAVVWAIGLGSGGDDFATELAVMPDGGVCITGSFCYTVDFDPGPAVLSLNSTGASDIFVARYGPSGNPIWARRMGGAGADEGIGIAAGRDGSLYLTGAFVGAADFDPGPGVCKLVSDGYTDGYVAKLDPQGNLVWAGRVGGKGWDWGEALVCGADDSLYLTGLFRQTADFDPGPGVYAIDSGGDADAFVVKLAAGDGSLRWARTQRGSSFAAGYDIAVDADNSVCFTGRFNGSVDLDPGAGTRTVTSAGADDVFITKLDSAGNFLWGHRMGSGGDDSGWAIATAPDRSVVTVGRFAGTVDFDPGPDASLLQAGDATKTFICTLDRDGNYLDAVQMGGGNYKFVVDVAAIGQGDVLVAGVFEGTADFDPGPGQLLLTSAGRSDLFLAKLTAAAPPGRATPGLYDPVESKFYLRYTNASGNADNAFTYGIPWPEATPTPPPGPGPWKPFAGDWNADGRDTIGLYDPTTSWFHLRNSNSAGAHDICFGYGVPGAGWTTLVGDWDGNGSETVGLFDPRSSTFFLRNSLSTGYADVSFGYGQPGAGWTPLVGDWDGDGADSVGLYDPTTGMFYLRNAHTTGVADTAFPFGVPNSGWTPLVGDWDGNGIETAGFYQPGDASHFYLRNTLDMGTSDIDFGFGFAGVTPIVGDWLGPTGNTIYLDRDAAGHGWFVDSTPAADEEFLADRRTGAIRAIDPRAVDRIDLMTVIEHELGHIAGLDDLEADATDLMSSRLGKGIRRLPGTQDLDALFARGGAP